MPLTQAVSGEKKIVRRITGSGETRRHLANLGFVEGGEVIVISDNGSGLIVSVKDARIALSRSMATRILV